MIPLSMLPSHALVKQLKSLSIVAPPALSSTAAWLGLVWVGRVRKGRWIVLNWVKRH